MSRPDSRQAAQAAAQSSAMAGAVDLSGLKSRAESRSSSGPAPSGGAARADTAAPGQAAGGGTHVVEVTEDTFQAEVLDRSMQVPVVVDLWAEWCGPCKQLSPVLERLAGEGNGAWVLAKVDVDANPRIAQAFQVQSIPTVMVIAGQQAVTSFSGAQPEPQLREWIAQILDALRERMPAIAEAESGAGEAAGDAEGEPAQEPEDPRFTAAEEALERGDHAAAEAAYQQILDAEPGNAEATAALAQVRFLARADAVDPSAIGRADAAPDDVDAQLAAADAEVAAGSAADAFDRLVATVGRTAGDERERARNHLVGLFDLFAADDPRVSAARRALAKALF